MFSSCDNLISVTLPDGITSIVYKMFENCSRLTNITIPNSVTRIEDMAFYKCNSLTSITIPNSVTFIRWAFLECRNLTIYYQGSKSEWNSIIPTYNDGESFTTIPSYVKVVCLGESGTSSSAPAGSPSRPARPTFTPTSSAPSSSGETSSSVSSPTLIIPPVEEQPIVLTDDETGVKLGAKEGVLPPDATLVVEPSDFVLTDATGKFAAFDISLESGGVKIQPNGKVQVSIPVPSDYDMERLTVYHIAEDGTKTELPCAVTGGAVTFETDHFSLYVVAEKDAAQMAGENNGGSLVIWIVVSIVLAAGAGCGFALWWFKLRKKPAADPEQ